MLTCCTYSNRFYWGIERTFYHTLSASDGTCYMYTSNKPRGRPKKKYMDRIKEHMKLVGMGKAAAEDWFRWRQMWGPLKGTFIAKNHHYKNK